MSTIENNDIAKIINAMGNAPRLFDSKSYHAKSNAQLNLAGRTHYCEADTMRFFGSRISSAHETASGLLFYVIESVFLDFHKTKRGFRYVIFDIYGESVARLDLDSAYKTSEQARKAMYEELNSFDVYAHYLDVFRKQSAKGEKLMNSASEAVMSLHKLNNMELVA